MAETAPLSVRAGAAGSPVADGAGRQRRASSVLGVGGPFAGSEMREQEVEMDKNFRLTSDPVEIVFKDITYTVQDGKGETKQILHGIDGILRPRELVAIMGPSGAGKTTFLNILTGQRVRNVGGSILVNGQERDLPTFRKCASYVMQDDKLFDNLTVQETMMVSARLRLDENMPELLKRRRVDSIMRAVDLWDTRNTPARQVSGGQRKRLCVALELVRDPPVIFLDEPTSGLDSTTAYEVCEFLKKLAIGGRTIVATIHQPSARLFQLFDKVHILTKGRPVYQGRVYDLLPTLESHGLKCPMQHNPADFVMEVASDVYNVPIETLVEANRARQTGDAIKPANYPPLAYPVPAHGGRYNTTLKVQFQLLLQRAFQSIWRDRTMMKVRVYSHLLVAFVCGLLYLNMGKGQDSVNLRLGFIFFNIIFLLLTAIMPTVLTFPIEREIFQREHMNNSYAVLPYYASITVADLPIQFILPFVYGTLVFLMSGQDGDADRFFLFNMALIMHSLVSQSVGLVVSTVAPTLQTAVFAAPIIAVPMILFCGFLVRIFLITHALRWLQYFSYIKLSFEIMLIVLFRDINLKQDSPFGNYSNGDEVISAEFHVDRGVLGELFLGMFLWFAILRVLGYFVLRWKAKTKE